MKLESKYLMYKEYLKFFIPSLVIIIAVFIIIISYRTNQLKTEALEKGNKIIQLAKNTFDSNLHIYVSDALILARMMSLHLDHSNKITEGICGHIEEEFLMFLKGREVYDQLRLIDASGQEMVRVNITETKPFVVPRIELQNKKHRAYFSKGMETEKDVYISEFDLNIENKKIEMPIKPMIRFVAKAYDKKNNKCGVIVLNFLGEYLIRLLKEISEQYEGDIYLVNDKSYWLLGPEPEQEWGFMYDDRDSARFNVNYPELWESIKQKNNGSMFVSNELFTFTEVYPTPQDKSLIKFSFNAEEKWWIIAKSKTDYLSGNLLSLYFICGFTIFLIAIIILYLTKYRVNRKISEHAIHLAKRQLELSFDAMDTHISILDLGGKIQYANKYMKNRFEPIHGNIIGLDYRFIYCGSDNPIPQPPCAAVLTGSEAVTVETQLPTMDGWYLVSSFPVHDLDEKLIGAVSIVEDITERKKTQEELIQSKENWKNLSEHVPDVITTIDKNLNIIFINHTVTGRKKEEVIGSSILEYIYIDDKEKTRKTLHSVFEHRKEIKNYEVRGISENNQIMTYSCRITPIINEDQVFAITIIITDITEQKQVEKELKEYAETQKILFREVNHRVKNNLSSLISIIHNEEEKMKKAEEKKSIIFLKDFESRIISLAIVHEMLSAEEWKPIRIDKLISRIILDVGKRVMESTSINLELLESDILVDNNLAHNLSLVINELTMNSLKYNHMERKELKIIVKIEKLNSNLVIHYNDDGPGYPESILAGDINNKKSGLEFVEGIVTHTLSGDVVYKNVNGAFTTLTFPTE